MPSLRYAAAGLVLMFMTCSAVDLMTSLELRQVRELLYDNGCEDKVTQCGTVSKLLSGRNCDDVKLYGQCLFKQCPDIRRDQTADQRLAALLVEIAKKYFGCRTTALELKGAETNVLDSPEGRQILQLIETNGCRDDVARCGDLSGMEAARNCNYLKRYGRCIFQKCPSISRDQATAQRMANLQIELAKKEFDCEFSASELIPESKTPAKAQVPTNSESQEGSTVPGNVQIPSESQSPEEPKAPGKEKDRTTESDQEERTELSQMFSTNGCQDKLPQCIPQSVVQKEIPSCSDMKRFGQCLSTLCPSIVRNDDAAQRLAVLLVDIAKQEGNCDFSTSDFLENKGSTDPGEEEKPTDSDTQEGSEAPKEESASDKPPAGNNSLGTLQKTVWGSLTTCFAVVLGMMIRI